jgi:hypothetical protein
MAPAPNLPSRMPPPAAPLDFSARKEQQLVFLLTRELADAQFVQADRPRSERLWQEVAALEIDPERITALLYEVSDHSDRAAMEEVDQAFLCPPPRHGLWSRWSQRALFRGGRRREAWPRSARSAAPPARPAAR